MKGLIITVIALFMVVTAGSARGGTYVIGDEDVLQITVWGNQELSVVVPVRPDGMISVPLLGDVQATGNTPQELKAALERGLARFVKAPVVSVIVTAVNSFKVYVFGEGISRSITAGSIGTEAGGRPNTGVITLRKNTSLLQLMAQLGSLRDADFKRAYLLRKGKKLNVDFVALITLGDNSEDVQLATNDVIYIPDNFSQRIRIIGAVRTPTTVPYVEGMTALDAVLSAGGFTDFADQNDVVIVRNDGARVRSLRGKLNDVLNGNISRNVLLLPGDIVTVHSGLF